MEEQEEEGTNGFNDWESLPSTHNRHNHHPSSSSHKLPPLQTTHSRHHHNHDHHRHLSIFPPINHEGLPIPPPPPPPPNAPLSFSNCNSDSDSLSPSPSPPPPKPRNSQLIKWFGFALHLLNSKLHSSLTLLRSRGFFSSFLPVATTAWILAVLWFWMRRRRWQRQRLRSHVGKESIEHLKLVIKEKDEKIIQLLEQIALMNKVLLARYKIPVLRAS